MQTIRLMVYILLFFDKFQPCLNFFRILKKRVLSLPTFQLINYILNERYARYECLRGPGGLLMLAVFARVCSMITWVELHLYHLQKM